MSFSLASIVSDDLGIGPTASNVVTSEQGQVANILQDKLGTFPSLEKITETKVKIETEKIAETEGIIKDPPAKPTGEPGINLETLVQKLEPQQSSADKQETTNNNIITSYLQSKIESGDFFTWSDYDEKKQPLAEYLNTMSDKDKQELLDKNIEKQRNLGYETAPAALREALPPKAQYVIDYLEQGGQDLESLFSSLAKAVQVEKLDPANEAHMPEIARNYLQLKNFGSAEMINAQVSEWAEDGKLESKVKEFKPLLDKMQEEQVQYQVQQETALNKQRQEAAQAYVQNVTAVLGKYEVGGLKMSKKDASALYYDLTEANYQSMSGKPTNIIGHMLEKIQYVEPNFDYVAEVAWLLRDREGFKNAIRTSAKSEKAQEIARELKDAQYIKTQAHPQYEQEETVVKKQFKPRNVFSKP